MAMASHKGSGETEWTRRVGLLLKHGTTTDAAIPNAVSLKAQWASLYQIREAPVANKIKLFLPVYDPFREPKLRFPHT